MIPEQTGNIIGQFVLSLSFAAVWLGMGRLVPALKRRLSLGSCYAVAALVVLLTGLLPIAPLGLMRLLGCLPVLVLLYFGWKQARRSLSLNTDTIVSYFGDTIIGKR